MSSSHRREVIDNHMNDSNWKKLIDIGRCLAIDIILALTCFCSQCLIYMLLKGTFRSNCKLCSI
ncbi:hypothetical protein EI94DRAFT_1615121 [Lactarius quietus]|nr:hypothetical protein EI94DRAFT_1615121 [Lactarius quietus]